MKPLDRTTNFLYLQEIQGVKNCATQYSGGPVGKFQLAGHCLEQMMHFS